MATNTFSFTSPTDILTAQQQIERQRRMAEILQQQAMEQDGNSQVVSGWVVNDALGKGISKLGSALMARNAMNRADQSAKDFGQARTAFAQKAFEDFQNEITPRTLGEGEVGPRYNPTPADVSKAQARLLMNLGGDPMESAKLMANAATQDAQRSRLLQMFAPQQAINAPQATTMALSETAAAGMPGPTNQAAVRQFELYGQRPTSPNNPNNIPPEMLVDAYLKDPIKAIELTTPKYSQTPQYDQQGRAFVMDERGNMKFLDGVKARDKMEIAPSGQVYNPYEVKPGTAFADPNKPFSIGPDGEAVPNNAYINHELSKASLGATRLNIPINTEKTYAGNLGEGLAKADLATIEAGRSAPQRLDSATRVLDLLKQNPITGTAADWRLGFNKALSTAGIIDGKRVTSTESLVTELAGQTLDSIRSSGLGAGNGFSNADREFLERARAGKIDMTPQAIQRTAELNQRAAIASIKKHNDVVTRLKKDPNMGSVAGSLDVIPLMPMNSSPAAPASGGRVVDFGSLK